jgi:hypothetical protein
MNCNECQNIIEDFIHDRLDLATANAFSEHIRLCDNCYNELEINYCMQTAIAELKSDSVSSDGDFKGMLLRKLSDSVEKYKVFQRNLKIKLTLIVVYLITAGIFLV